MDATLGEIFKKIRLSKNIGSKGLAEPYFSYPQLMKFESGSSSISYDKFIYLLRAINLTAEEFEYSYYKLRKDTEFKIASEVLPAYLGKNRLKLKYLLEKLEKLLKNNREQRLRLECLRIKSALQRLGEPVHIQKKEMSELFYYLDSVYEWSRYEVYLFDNCIGLFTLPQLRILYSKILYPRSDNISSIRLQSEKNIALLNTVSILIVNKYFGASHEIFTYLESHIAPGRAMTERSLFVFYKKLLAYQQERSEENYRAVQSCISSFENFECYYLAERARNDLKKIEDYRI
ncbi:MAG: hypothetical protein LBV19_07450 [Streptococcaceae bacterium]|jgi:Rgg/GadR/MutR family transcriptional activator|nr:hypothetical protein [Streptococcaceae bacterium]